MTLSQKSDKVLTDYGMHPSLSQTAVPSPKCLDLHVKLSERSDNSIKII